MTRKAVRCALAIAAGLAGLALDGDFGKGPAISTAQAVIGRPLTPMSYAGVARRTTRRAAYAGAATASAYAYAAPPVYSAPPPAYGGGCTQTTDAYGRIVTTC